MTDDIFLSDYNKGYYSKLSNAGEDILEIVRIKKLSRADRINELGNDLDKNKISISEGNVGVEIEEKYGYFKRFKAAAGEKGDWISLSGEYKGKNFDEMGGELGQGAINDFAYKPSQKIKFFKSIDKHFIKADYVVLNLTEMKKLQPSLYQDVLDYILTKYGNAKLINVTK